VLVERYYDKLSGLPIILPPQNDGSSWHLFVIQIDHQKVNISKPEVFNKLREKGVGVNVHYIPVHTHPYYQELGFNKGDYPVSENYYEHAITLPLFPLLTDEEQDYICDTLKDILNNG
jgi:dTDP-4-amino-4,6-dideoxygalactose transaminase